MQLIDILIQGDKLADQMEELAEDLQESHPGDSYTFVLLNDSLTEWVRSFTYQGDVVRVCSPYPTTVEDDDQMFEKIESLLRVGPTVQLLYIHICELGYDYGMIRNHPYHGTATGTIAG
jgi:hypothetical protein